MRVLRSVHWKTRTSSSAVAERPCKLSDFEGWITLRLNFRLKGYHVFCTNICELYTTTLRLEVFIQRNFVADFIRLKLNFIFKKKNKKLLFEPPFGELRGNVRTPSTAHWKARRRLPIRHNWTFFCYLLRLRRYKRKSVEVCGFRRGWSLWAQISDGRGCRPPTTVGVRKENRVIAVACGIKISAVHCLLLSQITHVTDGRTDRITTANTALA